MPRGTRSRSSTGSSRSAAIGNRSGTRPAGDRARLPGASTLSLIAILGVVTLAPGCRESAPTAEGEVPSLRLGPLELEIGVLDGDPAYQFSQLFLVRTLEDGSLLVIDHGVQEISRFAADGTHLWSAGGKGDAPGEFTFVIWVEAAEGVVRVWDWFGRRLSVFDLEDGDFRSSHGLSWTGSFARVVGRFSDDSYLAYVEDLAPSDRPGIVDNAAKYVRLREDTPPDTVLAFRGSPWIDVQGVITQMPFTTLPWAAVRGDTIWMQVPEQPGYARIDPDGTEARMATAVRERPLTDEMRTAALEAALAGEDDPGRREAEEESMALSAEIETIPAYDRLIVGEDRRVWLRRFDPIEGSARRWDIYDHDGVEVARASLPIGFRLTEAGADYVLGIWVDDLDVSYVRRYGLVPATESGGRS